MRARPAAFAALLGLAAPAGAALSFESVFAPPGEPASLHAVLLYRSGGAVHRMEMWRDGDRRIARATDGAVRSYASRRPGDPGYRLTVLDDHRRIRTDIDRDSLYHIGSFTDWYDLAHGLRHPLGHYKLTATGGPHLSVKPAAPCGWYALAQGGRTTHVCWNTRYHLPMLITSEGDMLVWRVLAVDAAPIAKDRFVIADKGYVRVNANRDIEGD